MLHALQRCFWCSRGLFPSFLFPPPLFEVAASYSCSLLILFLRAWSSDIFLVDVLSVALDFSPTTLLMVSSAALAKTFMAFARYEFTTSDMLLALAYVGVPLLANCRLIDERLDDVLDLPRQRQSWTLRISCLRCWGCPNTRLLHRRQSLLVVCTHVRFGTYVLRWSRCDLMRSCDLSLNTWLACQHGWSVLLA